MSEIKPCPKPFSFKNPETKKGEGGTVLKEEVVECASTEHRDYHKVVQLLQYKDGGFAIRFGYYLKRRGAKENEWLWGSQTTLIIRLESVRPTLDALANLMETYKKLEK